eukprot:3448485-Prymnesium_polylepis.1
MPGRHGWEPDPHFGLVTGCASSAYSRASRRAGWEAARRARARAPGSNRAARPPSPAAPCR